MKLHSYINLPDHCVQFISATAGGDATRLVAKLDHKRVTDRKGHGVREIPMSRPRTVGLAQEIPKGCMGCLKNMETSNLSPRPIRDMEFSWRRRTALGRDMGISRKPRLLRISASTILPCTDARPAEASRRSCDAIMREQARPTGL